MKFKFLPLLLLAGSLFAQVAAPAPKVDLVSSAAVQNAILRAEHKLDVASHTKDQAEVRFHEIQTIWQNADKDAQAGQAEVSKALDAAYAEKGFSKADYTYDPANFTFAPVPKGTTSQVVAAPAAVKK